MLAQCSDRFIYEIQVKTSDIYMSGHSSVIWHLKLKVLYIIRLQKFGKTLHGVDKKTESTKSHTNVILPVKAQTSYAAQLSAQVNNFKNKERI